MQDALVRSVGTSLLDALQEWGLTERPSAFGDVYERSWSEELVTTLRGEGTPAEHQRYYPGSSLSCDIVVTLSNQDELWVEVKGAWSVIARGVQGATPTYRRNGNFRKHLITDPKESAIKDVSQKLPSILAPTRHAALLLIGYDLAQSPMDAAISEFIQLAGLTAPTWSTLARDWTNPFDPAHRSRCWFWYRLGSLSAARNTVN